MSSSQILLTLGVLAGLWDQAFGMRNWPNGKTGLKDRFEFAWNERKATLVGSVLVLISIVLQVLGH